MNYYSFGNPRGTSNSEYGKFSFLSSLQGPNNNLNGNNLTGSHNHKSWKDHNHQHHANCPNHGLNHWTSQGQQGDWYQGEDGSNFTVQVGQEAANAVLGGDANFETAFSMPQNPSVPQSSGDVGLVPFQEDQYPKGQETLEPTIPDEGNHQSPGESGDHIESKSNLADPGIAVENSEQQNKPQVNACHTEVI